MRVGGKGGSGTNAVARPRVSPVPITASCNSTARGGVLPVMTQVPWRSSFVVLPCLLAASALRAAPPVDFSRDIQPLFAEHCLECHGPDASKGGLVLTTRLGATKELEERRKRRRAGRQSSRATIIVA